MKIRISGLVPESIVDGRGIRYTVFTQGCHHNCRNCHNPQTHDPKGGFDKDTDEIFKEFAEDPILKGITFSGGEPFLQPAPLADLAKKVHAAGKDVTCYTGFTYEQLKAMNNPDVEELLNECDVLIDGKFVEELKNLELKFRGSENQRVIDMEATRRAGHPVIIQDIDM